MSTRQNKEVVLPSGITVCKNCIIGSEVSVYSAWVEIPKGKNHMWGTHMTFNNKWYGRIGTDPDRSKYIDLPVGLERTKEVARAYRERFELAYEAILEAFPGIQGARLNGEIEVVRL